jgi:hypothetical protein
MDPRDKDDGFQVLSGSVLVLFPEPKDQGSSIFVIPMGTSQLHILAKV